MARKSIDPITKRRGMELSRRIREVREAKSMSQEELARSVNISVETVRALEQEKTLVPGVFLAVDIIRELEGNVNEWLSSSGGKQRSSKRSR